MNAFQNTKKALAEAALLTHVCLCSAHAILAEESAAVCMFCRSLVGQGHTPALIVFRPIRG